MSIVQPQRPPEVSVVIPTYNRKDSLLRALESLCRQTLPGDRYEVIIVDDGSMSYGVNEVARHHYPFRLTCLCQQNQGATIARNNGARNSQGNVLVFMDDDVTVTPNTLVALYAACTNEDRVLIMGTLIQQSSDMNTPFAHHAVKEASSRQGLAGSQALDRTVHFSFCNTQLLAMRREDFFQLDMLQDPTGGWPNWDDVDFGYRAHQVGFRLLQAPEAVGYHWDYALSDLTTACGRWERASCAAVELFQRHPYLQAYIPMFRDKGPIVWQQDPPMLILHKLARQLISSQPVMAVMEKAVPFLERHVPTSAALRLLYRWIISGYICRGYREGLRERQQKAAS